MLNEDFELFKEFILEKNPYFINGFANAYKDDITHAIYLQDGKDRRRLMPADNLGNYFYLRNDAWMKHEAKELQKLTDTGTQRLTFLDTMSTQLVAIVNNADAYQLIENLRITAMMYEGLDITPVTSSWNREQVVTTELTKVKAEEVYAALQRLENETIIRIGLSVNKIFTPGNCITEPIIK